MIRFSADWVLPISDPPISRGAVAVDDGRGVVRDWEDLNDGTPECGGKCGGTIALVRDIVVAREMEPTLAGPHRCREKVLRCGGVMRVEVGKHRRDDGTISEADVDTEHAVAGVAARRRGDRSHRELTVR